MQDTDWQEHCCQGNDSFTSNDNPDMPSEQSPKPGYPCDKFSSDASPTGNGTYSSDDHRACAKLLDLHNHVTGKPPRSPSNRSDSALGSTSSGTTSSKSDSSTQSSPSSSFPNPSEHIYDEPSCGSSSDLRESTLNATSDVPDAASRVELRRGRQPDRKSVV